MLGSGILVVCSLIWGFAFIPQRMATTTIGHIAFNCLRFVQAVIVLFVILLIFNFVNKKRGIKTPGWNKDTILGGALAGISLFLATNLQQYGLATSTVGKASFITAMYIVFVPLLGLLMGKRPSLNCCYAIVIAMAGFFMLCIEDGLKIELGDALLLLCALLLSMQISFIDIFCKDADPLKLTFVQFLVCALLGIPAMAIVGFPSGAEIKNSAFSLLYLGVLSAGVGFTLQTIGQKYTPPTLATLIMSMEAIIGILGGTLIMKEHHTMVQLCGCLVVFIAVFIAQIETHKTMLVFDKASFALTEKSKS